jgi:hypothetical protein
MELYKQNQCPVSLKKLRENNSDLPFASYLNIHRAALFYKFPNQKKKINDNIIIKQHHHDVTLSKILRFLLVFDIPVNYINPRQDPKIMICFLIPCILQGPTIIKQGCNYRLWFFLCCCMASYEPITSLNLASAATAILSHDIHEYLSNNNDTH